uniref:Methyltransferase n=1 Tax=viral metagenome TaxID=1070528 RepID=A0A6C0IGM8_9ZZZZ
MSCEKYALPATNAFTKKRDDYYSKLQHIYDTNTESIEKMIDFPKYAPTESLRQFLVRYELMKLIKDVPGDIIECGVCGGRGLLSLLQSHLILEPGFYFRDIVGFDTFTGFHNLNENDNINVNKQHDFLFSNEKEISTLGQIHTEQHFVETNKIRLIKGDATVTIPVYLESYPYTMVSLLYLDFDIYQPTKVALETFMPRMAKGSIIAFDEIHHKRFPGETIAMLELFNINHREIKNILHSNVNYFII